MICLSCLRVAAVCLLTAHAPTASAGTGVASYHLSFDDYSFLEDDYSARFAKPALERRNLRLVPGVFGRALHNDNAFSPVDFEKTYMSTRDLDVLLEVLCFHRFDYDELQIGGRQPYFWGTGRLKTDGGTVAFWARGARSQPGYLFFQGSSSFGRLEKYLLGIQLNEDASLEAFLVDARYRRHTIRSAPLWRADRFNHVALAWDRAQGLVLYLNGQKAASNWGSDVWWTAQIPGLFHLPMCGMTCDELWIFDRALTGAQVQRLVRENRPPGADEPLIELDEAAQERLRVAFIGTHATDLPLATPSADDRVLCFREVFPLSAGDGCVKAPCLLDGRYEMAWPMGYTSFTNILGDSDFQARKADFTLPPSARVNYVTMEGNLTGATLLAGTLAQPDAMQEVSRSPPDERFFHAAMPEPRSGAGFRIPFVKGYGSPPGYAEGLHLPLTGEVRLHEVSFFEVGSESQEGCGTGVSPVRGRHGGQPLQTDSQPAASSGDPIRIFRIAGEERVPDDGRCGYAMRALNDRRNAGVLRLTEQAERSAAWEPIAALTRWNLLSEPLAGPLAVKAIELNLHLRTVADGFLVLRLHDPGVPARIWTSVVLLLRGFESGGLLRVQLDITDIQTSAGDRLWLDLTFARDAEIEIGGQARSHVGIETAPVGEADPRYALKALQPALSSFTKIYSWYYPWILAAQKPDPEHPVTFGGYYDIVNYPPIILRTQPDHFIANALTELSLIKYDIKPAFSFEGWENSSKFWPPLPVTKSDDSPDWAFHMNYYLTRFAEIVHWWADRQNPDGQVGGGWNDDVVFAPRIAGPLLYLGDAGARRMFNRVIEGHEQTDMLRDGYCRIVPIDAMHAEDRVRHRYEALLCEPGEPYKMKLAMRTAWRFDQPDQTPVNYFDGRPFQYDRDLLLWYWGRTPEYPVYSVTREEVAAKMKQLAPAMNDIIRFRYTDAGMFTDGATMPGAADVKRLVVGGNTGPFLDALTLAACWEDGRGPTIPRWIEHASDTDFVAHLYSYERAEREVTVRLYRLKRGVYDIALAGEGKDASTVAPYRQQAELRRFSIVTVPIPPGREVVLRIQRSRELPDPGPLPDLCVDQPQIVDNRVQAEVLNFGPAALGPLTVRLESAAGKTIAERKLAGLQAATAFVPSIAQVTFGLNSPPSAGGRIIVDPDDGIPEITDDNNAARLP